MGISKQPERWHKCVAATKNALPSIVDRLFIEHFFSEQDRQTALTMLDYIRAAFKANLEKVNPALRVHTRAPAQTQAHTRTHTHACKPACALRPDGALHSVAQTHRHTHMRARVHTFTQTPTCALPLR